MDRLVALFQDLQISATHLEILKVCSLYSVALLTVGWLLKTLTWSMPTVLAFTRKVWADDKADATVKLVTSAFPMCLDTVSVWGGALAGWFLSVPGVDPAHAAGLAGLGTSLVTLFLTGIRWRETLPQTVNKAIAEVHRANLQASRSQEDLRLETQELGEARQDHAIELDRLAARTSEFSRKLGTFEEDMKRLLDVAQKMGQAFDATSKEVAKLRNTLTGPEKDTLKTILGLDLDKSFKVFRSEIGNMLALQKQHVDSEITKCVGLVEPLIPGMEASLGHGRPRETVYRKG